MTSSPRTKQRMTLNLAPELIERARDAVYWTPGLTLAGLTEKALVQFLEQLEKERGEPFPQRQGKLKSGRPISQKDAGS